MLHQIYEIRRKDTHQILYLNIFADGEKPDEVFKDNPDSDMFAGRLDLYLAVREESFEDKDKAWEACMKLFVLYKLMPPEKLEENIKTPRKGTRKGKPKAE